MVTMNNKPTIAVLGASGLIGHAVADDLARRGYAVTPIARKFTLAQRAASNPTTIEHSFVNLDRDALDRFIRGLNADQAAEPQTSTAASSPGSSRRSPP
jgi:short-subunit dehydrogenase